MPPVLPRFSCLALALGVVALAAGVADANPRRLSDLGNRSALEGSKFPTNTKMPQMNDRMQGQRVEFGQWHGSFSTLGSKRSNISTGDQFKTGMVDFSKIDRKKSDIAVEASERKMAPLRNHDQVRDIVIAEQFNKMAPRTKEGRTLQQMVDEVSLKDINRFQVHRNKTDDGVPVQRAGSNEAPTVAPKREKQE